MPINEHSLTSFSLYFSHFDCAGTKYYYNTANGESSWQIPGAKDEVNNYSLFFAPMCVFAFIINYSSFLLSASYFLVGRSILYKTAFYFYFLL